MGFATAFIKMSKSTWELISEDRITYIDSMISYDKTWGCQLGHMKLPAQSIKIDDSTWELVLVNSIPILKCMRKVGSPAH
jgi:hypothetical protein